METPGVTAAANSTIAETLAKLGVDPKAGLTDADVQKRLKKYEPIRRKYHQAVEEKKAGKEEKR